LAVEKDKRFFTLQDSNDALGFWTLIESHCHMGENFGFREYALQLKRLSVLVMGDKEHLDMFTNRFATEYFKLVSMLKRLHSGEEQKAVDFIFAIKARLVAAFFIEALPKHFDDLRKDMSNPKNSQFVQPDDLTEAFKLASDYNNVKCNRMTLASPPPGNSIVGISTTVDSSDPKALKLALAAIEKKQQQAAGSKPGNKSPPPPSTPPPATPADKSKSTK
jgi:hypothetical protein